MEIKQKKGSAMLANKSFTAGNSAEEKNNLLGAHSQIAEKLRAFYIGIQEEEIPSHLLNLLEKLDKAEKSNAPPKLQKSAENTIKAGKHG